MIGDVTVGTSDLKKAVAFHDKIAAETSIGRVSCKMTPSLI
jgi:hypothetical protein